MFSGRQMPVTWILSSGSIVSSAAIVASLAFWRWWARRWREPDELLEIALGVAIGATAPLLLVAASDIDASTGQRIGLGDRVRDRQRVAFANIFPIGLALYSRALPKGMGGVLIGVCYLHLFVANPGRRLARRIAREDVRQRLLAAACGDHRRGRRRAAGAFHRGAIAGAGQRVAGAGRILGSCVIAPALVHPRRAIGRGTSLKVGTGPSTSPAAVAPRPRSRSPAAPCRRSLRCRSDRSGGRSPVRPRLAPAVAG